MSSIVEPWAKSEPAEEADGLTAWFDELARRAARGCVASARAMLAEPARLKGMLDAMAGRAEGEGALSPRPAWGGAVPGLASEGFTRRFAERGMPASPEELARQYKLLEGRQGRADFKSDIQGIERAVLAGSVGAIREIAERSPMALWAMDFSLSEYESENILAFAAKYAPPGADVEIVRCLRDMGARLPAGRLRLEVGAAVAHGAGIRRKSPKECAEALGEAGYAFRFADGLELLREASMERPEAQLALLASRGASHPWPRHNLAREKVEWLDEMQSSGAVKWSVKLSAEELAEEAASMWSRAEGRCDQRVADFLAFAREEGSAGLGAWVGVASAPLRVEASWVELGPWLAKQGLAQEARQAAEATGAQLTLEALSPWADQQVLREELGGGAAGGCKGSAGRL